eukprot:g65000.t1
MSNRGRQIVASFLTKDLGIDWRWGAEWFEMNLLDYSPESNYGNWMYGAGVGTDPREDRYFNLAKQAYVYDEFGEHAKLWIKELQRVPGDKVHLLKDVSWDKRREWQLGEYGLKRVPATLGGFAPKGAAPPTRKDSSRSRETGRAGPPPPPRKIDRS